MPEGSRAALAAGGLLLVALAVGPAVALPVVPAAPVVVAAEGGGQDAVPATEVRRVVDDVLSRRAYQTSEPSWVARQAEAARAWLARLLIGMLQTTSRAVVGWAVLGIAAAVALFVAWRLVRGTRWEATRPPAVVDDERRSAAEWDARSREAERRGDLREAVRAAYRAVLAGYAELGLVAEVEGRTVGEYRRAVGTADPGRREVFGRASDVVEAVLYADRPASGADLAAVRRAAAGGGRRTAHAAVEVGA